MVDWNKTSFSYQYVRWQLKNWKCHSKNKIRRLNQRKIPRSPLTAQCPVGSHGVQSRNNNITKNTNSIRMERECGGDNFRGRRWDMMDEFSRFGGIRLSASNTKIKTTTGARTDQKVATVTGLTSMPTVSAWYRKERPGTHTTTAHNVTWVGLTHLQAISWASFFSFSHD
jgi:hypothetical protein